MGAFRVFSLLAMLAITFTLAIYDSRLRRIPNWLTYGGLLLAAVLSVLAGRDVALGVLGGFFICGGLFFVFWLFRGVGAGDVKAMAMVGAFVGFPECLDVVFLVALCGGVLGLGYIIWVKRPICKKTGKPVGLHARLKQERLPYGVAIAAGSWIWGMMWLFGLPF